MALTSLHYYRSLNDNSIMLPAESVENLKFGYSADNLKDGIIFFFFIRVVTQFETI